MHASHGSRELHSRKVQQMNVVSQFTSQAKRIGKETRANSTVVAQNSLQVGTAASNHTFGKGKVGNQQKGQTHPAIEGHAGCAELSPTPN